eukprot:9437062-Pyramimonas_sp.AAC.1
MIDTCANAQILWTSENDETANFANGLPEFPATWYDGELFPFCVCNALAIGITLSHHVRSEIERVVGYIGRCLFMHCVCAGMDPLFQYIPKERISCNRRRCDVTPGGEIIRYLYGYPLQVQTYDYNIHLFQPFQSRQQ